MKKTYRIIILILIITNIFACSRTEEKEKKIITVSARGFSNSLFYSGIIQPLKTVVIPVPVEGVIVNMPVQYGQLVKKNQLLFQISSVRFLTDYKSALMQYIKAKSDFNTSKTILSEAKFLHKNELISDDDYKMKQSSFYSAQLSLLQAKDTLEGLLHQLDIKDLDPYHLTIADVEKINKAMKLRLDGENIQVLAPAGGILLSAIKGEGENKKIVKGDVVKQGDVLAVIGDMSGINVRIRVNELTVNQLREGQRVNITGIAFPDETLTGEIIRVDKQGEILGGGFPTFNVEISVGKLTPAQQKIIHAGMSAKIKIDIKQPSQIMVPLTAIREKNGLSFVEIINEKTGVTQEVAIHTGKTTVDSVAILSGIKAGDKLVIPD